MKSNQQLIEVVENVAAGRPSYSLPNFLPRPVLELAVLNMLFQKDTSGDLIIRELAPLTRRASAFGVNYPLFHEMEAEGTLGSYRHPGNPKRIYTITEKGKARLQQLQQIYSEARPEDFQIGITLVPGIINQSESFTAFAC